MISPKVAYLRILLTEVKRVQRPAWNLAKLSPLSSPRAKVLSPRPWVRLNTLLDQSPPDSYLYAHREIFSSTTPTITGYSPDGNLPNYVFYISEISFHTYPSEDLAFGVVCGNDNSRSSMHLRSRYLPKPSASSPPDNKAHRMANPGQVPNLKGLHREIHDMAEQMRIMNGNNGRLMQLLSTANPQLPEAPPVPDIERSCNSNRSGDRSQNISTERVRRRRRAPSPSLRGRSSCSESSKTPARARRGRSPHRGDQIEARNKSTSQKIRDLDARLDAINTGTNALGCSDEVMCKAFSATLKGPARSWFQKLSPGTIDSFGDLSRLFVANFMSCRNRQKNVSHLFTVHQKETESLKVFVKRFNQAILEVKDPSDKVIIMAMMEGLRPGPLFDSLSKNVPETLSTLQSKADKYIAAEELAEAKQRQRGKDDHKRKKPDTRRIEYREETRHKRPDRNPKRSNDRRPRTLPRRPEGYLRKYVVTRPPPNSLERRYSDNKPTAGDIQTIHGGFGSGGCSTSSRKKHARSALRPAEEDIYNLFSSYVGDQTPITFSNDDLRGLHLPHDDALVVSVVIANFNVQRILIDNGSSADILFISAFERMKIGLEKLHPFHIPPDRIWRKYDAPLGMDQLTNNSGN
ncbi:hypothetical protein Acr_00g0011640 [Actinidia rufa]|uniref:Retrotransposon gag domain-containing protein n=1 Tax=Actinidia rufa TaxID=165716 RepID=A0A7J0D9H9_9ERIC|nr:hypothetical protein Acr_00g0011640 [Actinidia rufa]